MTKSIFKFAWVSRTGNPDFTKHLFTSWATAGMYAAAQERKDKGWRCISIERED